MRLSFPAVTGKAINMWSAAGKGCGGIGKNLNRELNGRGGGKNPMIQGSVQAEKAQIKGSFERVY